MLGLPVYLTVPFGYLYKPAESNRLILLVVTIQFFVWLYLMSFRFDYFAATLITMPPIPGILVLQFP